MSKVGPMGSTSHQKLLGWCNSKVSVPHDVTFFSFLFSFFETECQHASAKAQMQLTTWHVIYQVERRFHSRESHGVTLVSNLLFFIRKELK